MKAHFRTRTWAGSNTITCTILRETPTQYEIRMDCTAIIGKTRYTKGETRLVPKDAIILEGKLCYDYHICYSLSPCADCKELTERMMK